jgi:ribonuclease HI
MGSGPEWRTTNSWLALESRHWPPPFRARHPEERRAYRDLLVQELKENIIEHTTKEEVKWSNPTFLIKKASGEWRKILNCIELNRCLRDKTVKMETIQTVFELTQDNDWATTLDIKSAYSHVVVQRELRPFLAFEFEGRFYRYRTVPFGLKTAPRIFTKLMRPVAAWIRQHLKARICIYMDDLLILATSEEEARDRTETIKQLLTNLGLTLSPNKCHDIPDQRAKFLGWELDFRRQEMNMPRDRRRALLENLADLQTAASLRQKIPCRKLASTLGTLNFLRTQVPAASLYMSRLNRLKTTGVRRNGWDGTLTMTPMALGEIKWWRKTVAHNAPRRWKRTPTTWTITTDASPSGWGATLQQEQHEATYTWGTWSRSAKAWTSNRRELMGILHALRALTHSAQYGADICVRSDNTAAVFAFRGWKTTENRIPTLRKAWNLVETRGWTLTAQYLPGTLNSTADRLSRMGESGEYSMTMTALKKIQDTWQIQLTLDAFASSDTARLPRYCSKDKSDGSAVAIDSLTHDWRGEVVLLHPPPALILRTVQKAIVEQATGVLVIPSWGGQAWTPLVDQISGATIDLGPYETAARRSKVMTSRGWLLPPGNLCAHLMVMKMTTEKPFLTN